MNISRLPAPSRGRAGARRVAGVAPTRRGRPFPRTHHPFDIGWPQTGQARAIGGPSPKHGRHMRPMTKRPPPAAAPRNRFLDRLPGAEYRRLYPFLQPVELAGDRVLYEARGPIDYAYFPTGAVLSALTVM